MRSGAFRQELPYWLAEARAQVRPLPIDHADGHAHNTEESARMLRSALSAEATRALLQATKRHERDNLQVLDLLLAALARSIAAWSDQPYALVLMSNHGRLPLLPDIDLTRTVGFVAFHFPMLLDTTNASTPAQAVRAIKQQLRDLPAHGIGYGALRYLSDDRALVHQLQSMPNPDIFFNYVGVQGHRETTWIRPARESSGPGHAPMQSRLRALMCRAQIAADQLTIDWGYSENLHHRSTIARLADVFHQELLGIIQTLLAPNP
jgi:non-ribosomal peptide synthase protein (TIGR01720 family)